MSDLYFIRHGQAGTRLKYDTLSDIGHQQARLLGAYLSKQAVAFSDIVIGGLERHRETAQSVLDAYQIDGVGIPDPVVDHGWDEFDLDAVYKAIAPQLARDDLEFATAYEAMLEQIASQGGAQQSQINRRWNPCDVAVIHAWVAGRYPVECETWLGFRSRIQAALAKVVAANPQGNVAVFTSATPTAICVAGALGASDAKMFQLAGVMINSAFSVLRLKDADLRVFNFNAAPHLEDAALRTHR